MTDWDFRQVPFRYQLSDLTIASIPLLLQCSSIPITETPQSEELLTLTANELVEGSQGFMVRALPITQALPSISHHGEFIRYVPLQYDHCYIDLSLTFDDYQKKFSSKTRSTIKRKINKFAKHSGGLIRWKSYKKPSQLRDFFQLAESVSKRSYQERLLDAGLPRSETFIQHAELLSAENRLRAYILFDSELPVAYLYCPVENGVLMYSYLGYDPEYMKLSVGTVLQWLALEDLFAEGCFKAFDFTEGYSEHKRLFATHQLTRANIFLIKASPGNKALIHSHLLMNRFSNWLGAVLDRLGIRAKIKRLIRFR